MDQRVELLAPAGNMEGFYGAIHVGADAVYLGGKHFGARANADNFSQEELLSCIRYAHIWGRRVYLTVNTLVKEKEFSGLSDFLQPLYEAALDGVIVQDIGALVWIKERFPGLKLHASTQMTVTGKYGAGLLKQLGVERVVPARELSLYEIEELKRASGLEVETFIHGAMCYCYSGQCLFSSILGGRSGNRGRCAQPCRLPYRVERDGRTTEEEYPLSLKDMCTIELIPRLIEAGIDSFKIEGRMKRPEYAAGVTSIYRKYIDRYYAAGGAPDGKWEIEPEDLRLLGSLYIRSERQDGYYFRQNGRGMVTLKSPSYSRLDETATAGIRREFIEGSPKLEIGAYAEFCVGEPARLVLSLDRGGRRVQVAVRGESVSEAVKQPITKENIAKQLRKLGDTPFQIGMLEIVADENAFYSLKAINELRRGAAALLEDALIEENGFPVRRDRDAARGGAAGKVQIRGDKKREAPEEDRAFWHIGVRSRAQFDAVAKYIKEQKGRQNRINCTRVYLEADLFLDALESGDATLTALGRGLVLEGCELVLALPYILRGKDGAWLESLWEAFERHRDLFSGFLVRSLEGLGFIREQRARDTHGHAAIYGDAGVYAWNSETIRVMGEREEGLGLDGFCLPYELNAGEQRGLLEGIRLSCEKIVYGRIPLMITANCIAGTVDGCRSGDGGAEYYLIDRYRKRFPAVQNCRHCVNVIYNCIPLSLHSEIDKWRGKVGLRLDFTVEDGEKTGAVLRYFGEGSREMPFYEYTAGHEKRGAE